jgi:hypothetical protein
MEKEYSCRFCETKCKGLLELYKHLWETHQNPKLLKAKLDGNVIEPEKKIATEIIKRLADHEKRILLIESKVLGGATWKP